MLLKNLELVLAGLPDDARVLDVGGWGAPVNRATHMLDLMPYETRGGMPVGSFGEGPERFTRDTWLIRDMCDREPWPYADDYFDVSICVMTLEDVRDPIWVCQELSRVARRGYIETPSLLGELKWRDVGDSGFVGHQHHRWFVHMDSDRSEAVFTHKTHAVHAEPRLRIPPDAAAQLSVEEQCQGMLWEGAFTAREEVVIGPHALDRYIDVVARRFGDQAATWELAPRSAPGRAPRRVARAIKRRLQVATGYR
jgi:hypothetical protein